MTAQAARKTVLSKNVQQKSLFLRRFGTLKANFKKPSLRSLNFQKECNKMLEKLRLFYAALRGVSEPCALASEPCAMQAKRYPGIPEKVTTFSQQRKIFCGWEPFATSPKKVRQAFGYPIFIAFLAITFLQSRCNNWQSSPPFPLRGKAGEGGVHPSFRVFSFHSLSHVLQSS